MARETIAGLKSEIDRLRSERDTLRNRVYEVNTENQQLKKDAQDVSYKLQGHEYFKSQLDNMRGILDALGATRPNTHTSMFVTEPVDRDLLRYLFEKFGVSLDVSADQS